MPDISRTLAANAIARKSISKDIETKFCQVLMEVGPAPAGLRSMRDHDEWDHKLQDAIKRHFPKEEWVVVQWHYNLWVHEHLKGKYK